MKKLMRKLVLSSFALGLAVITLTTTTFAWYTSNTVVKANDITGHTAESGDPLLMIAQTFTEDAEHTKWYTSVDVEEKTFEVEGDTYTSEDMVPLQLKDDGLFYDVKDVKAKYGWLEFTLYFKNASSSSVPLYVSSFTIVNNDKANLPAKDVLDAGRAAMGNTSDPTYTIDVLRTLLLSTTTTTYTMEENDDYVSAEETPDVPAKVLEGNTVERLFDVEGLATLADDDFGEGWNALSYYNTIMTSHAEKEATVHDNVEKLSLTSGTALQLATVPGAGNPEGALQYVEIKFMIFIDGWDSACFDACQGQSITINLQFSTEAGSVKVAA